MARLFASLLLVWSFLVGPTLCVGGFLEHSCDHGGETEVQCEHEDGCADDPCASWIRAPYEESHVALDFEMPQIPVAVTQWGNELGSAKWPRCLVSPPPPDRSNLPYAQSDRPLLI